MELTAVDLFSGGGWSLTGTWNPDAFGHSMMELLASVVDREPIHSAVDTLRTLDVVFAAVQSAATGEPVRPGDVGELPAG